MNISAQGQVCIEGLTAVLRYSVLPQEDKYSPLNREETLIIISHCWLQDRLEAEREMTHNKKPGSPIWPLNCSVQDSSSFKKGAGNLTTQSQPGWGSGKKQRCLFFCYAMTKSLHAVYQHWQFLFYTTNLPIKTECNVTHWVLHTYCTPCSHSHTWVYSFPNSSKGHQYLQVLFN